MSRRKAIDELKERRAAQKAAEAQAASQAAANSGDTSGWPPVEEAPADQPIEETVGHRGGGILSSFFGKKKPVEDDRPAPYVPYGAGDDGDDPDGAYAAPEAKESAASSWPALPVNAPEEPVKAIRWGVPEESRTTETVESQGSPEWASVPAEPPASEVAGGTAQAGLPVQPEATMPPPSQSAVYSETNIANNSLDDNVEQVFRTFGPLTGAQGSTFAEIQQKLAERVQELAEANKDLETFNKQVSELERRLTEATARADGLTEELTKATARADKAEAEAKESRDRLVTAMDQRDEANRKRDEARERLASEVDLREQAEKELQALRKEHEQLEAERTSLAKAHEADAQRIAGLQEELQRLRQTHESLIAYHRDAQRKLGEAEQDCKRAAIHVKERDTAVAEAKRVTERNRVLEKALGDSLSIAAMYLKGLTQQGVKLDGKTVDTLISVLDESEDIGADAEPPKTANLN